MSKESLSCLQEQAAEEEGGVVVGAAGRRGAGAGEIVLKQQPTFPSLRGLFAVSVVAGAGYWLLLTSSTALL